MRALRIAVGLSVLCAGMALAQGTYQPRFARDREGDAGRSGLDVVRVALGRTSGGDLRAEVTMAEGWDGRDLRSEEGPGSVCVRIFSRREPASEPPDHLVCATPRAEGRDLVGRVLRERRSGPPRKGARARVSRPTRRTVFLRFTPRSIGRPARIQFGAETVTRGARCPEPVGCRDLAPDAPDVIALSLR